MLETRLDSLPPLDALDFVVGLLSLTAVLAASVASPARGQQPTPLEGPAGVVYTADEYGSSISAVNLATGQVDTVPLSISPHNVQITADGGEESQCGWLKDRFGLSWQVVPTALSRLLADPDPEKSRRVMAAMLRMKKLDIAALEAAR